MKNKSDFKEEDMYLPVKKFFLSLGYDVKSEVKDCDVALSKDGRLIVIEMKKSFNMTLIYQGIERQKIADEVYLAVPRMKRTRNDDYHNMLHVVKKMGFGLITVAMDSPIKTVEILVFSDHEKKHARRNEKKRNIVIKEMEQRTIDLNVGGSNKKKIVTAYRERAIQAAVIIEKIGAVSASELIKEHACPNGVYAIMNRNEYGWFEKIGRGLYGLTKKGYLDLADEQIKELVQYYRNNNDLLDKD